MTLDKDFLIPPEKCIHINRDCLISLQTMFTDKQIFSKRENISVHMVPNLIMKALQVPYLRVELFQKLFWMENYAPV